MNNIQKLEFGLKNPQAARSQALKQAALQAKANVEAIADGLGVHILRVLSAEEGGPEEPQTNFAMAKAAISPAAPTQIEAGTVEVQVTVVLRAEVSQ